MKNWRFHAVNQLYQALLGVRLLTAAEVVAELVDLSGLDQTTDWILSDTDAEKINQNSATRSGLL